MKDLPTTGEMFMSEMIVFPCVIIGICFILAGMMLGAAGESPGPSPSLPPVSKKPAVLTVIGLVLIGIASYAAS